ncbi:MAG: hypothetical protein KDA75_04545 [Planctomycetaceae bacterium]|nr:hypothetical protein [Planctomycetaceae bacterium]
MILLLLGLSFVSAQAPADDARLNPVRTQTLFAFDDVAIPFTQNLKLRMNRPQRHPANPVVRRGPPGSCDSWAVQFYGTVIREGETLRMWYVAAGDDRLDREAPRSSPWRVAYAESRDGVNWMKPDLGLVEYRGSTENNLVRMEPRLGTVNVKVLHDPDDPDPERRYKLGAHVWFPKSDVRLGTLAPYASRDGLDWKLLIDAVPSEFELPQQDLVLPALHFEPVGGLYKWDGLFHLAGQNAIVAPRPYHGRVVRHFVSSDFVNWSSASAVGFVRTPQHDLLGPGRSREGEQNHEGLSVWNRGNVLLGIAGRWHGGREWDDVTVDLGFVVSNDGLHFREPLHEWTFLERGADGEWDVGGLLQGQGFENIGDETFIYYGAWDPRNWEGSPPRGGVGIAVLPRDRFGELVVDTTTQGTGNYQLEHPVCELMTSSLSLSKETPWKLSANVSGLGPAAVLKVELLGHDLRPLPGYSGTEAARVASDGYETPVEWNGRGVPVDRPDRLRIRVTLEGEQRTDIRLYALYLRPSEAAPASGQ